MSVHQMSSCVVCVAQRRVHATARARNSPASLFTQEFSGELGRHAVAEAHKAVIS
jgi:hypothetical protein